MRIVFATGNKDKMREIRQILGSLGMEIVSMKEAGVFEDVEEFEVHKKKSNQRRLDLNFKANFRT